MIVGPKDINTKNNRETLMNALDQTQAGAYHVAQLRAEARRAADVRAVAPRAHLRTLLRGTRQH